MAFDRVAVAVCIAVAALIVAAPVGRILVAVGRGLRMAAIAATAAVAIVAVGFAVYLVVAEIVGRHRRPPAFLDTTGDNGRTLVADADREWMFAILSDANRRGYLDPDDYGDRYAAVHVARTRKQLVDVLDGLPAELTGMHA